MINKVFDKIYEKYEKKTYIESEIDKFLEKYEDKNISISYDKDKDTGKYKNKFDTEEITKKLCNKFINLDEFNEEYNKFTDNVAKLENFKSEKEKGSVSQKQKKIIGYKRDLGNIVDLYNLYNLKSGNDTSKKGEGLKILTNKQMLNRLPILLAQIQAGNNSKSLKNELRQILYSLHRSKVLTKTV